MAYSGAASASLTRGYGELPAVRQPISVAGAFRAPMLAERSQASKNAGLRPVISTPAAPGRGIAAKRPRSTPSAFC